MLHKYSYFSKFSTSFEQTARSSQSPIIILCPRVQYYVAGVPAAAGGGAEATPVHDESERGPSGGRHHARQRQPVHQPQLPAQLPSAEGQSLQLSRVEFHCL